MAVFFEDWYVYRHNANLIGYYFWGASGIECGVRSLKWCIRGLVLLPAEKGRISLRILCTSYGPRIGMKLVHASEERSLRFVLIGLNVSFLQEWVQCRLHIWIFTYIIFGGTNWAGIIHVRKGYLVIAGASNVCVSPTSDNQDHVS